MRESRRSSCLYSKNQLPHFLQAEIDPGIFNEPLITVKHPPLTALRGHLLATPPDLHSDGLTSWIRLRLWLEHQLARRARSREAVTNTSGLSETLKLLTRFQNKRLPFSWRSSEPRTRVFSQCIAPKLPFRVRGASTRKGVRSCRLVSVSLATQTSARIRAWMCVSHNGEFC